MKAAVAKATSPNDNTYIIVINFIRFIGTYDKKAAHVVSANIGGPGDWWVKKTNFREQKDCIIDSGEENKKVAQRMEATIKRRKIQGGKYFFLLLFMQQRLLKSWRCHMRMELSLAGNNPST